MCESLLYFGKLLPPPDVIYHKTMLRLGRHLFYRIVQQDYFLFAFTRFYIDNKKKKKVLTERREMKKERERWRMLGIGGGGGGGETEVIKEY